MDPEYNHSIIDASQPNAGRIYDYLIGGSHNFDIDRKVGDGIKAKAPVAPKLLKFIRWFLQEAISRAKEWGFTQFIDFASGLPVKDHIHKNTPEGTKVIYSDIDPVTVEYGIDIIGENPIVKYVTCDAATPEKLLKSDIVTSLFGNNHKAAIGYTGISWFLSDEQINHAMKTLYEWANEGSIIYTSFMDNPNPTVESQEFIKLYTDMKQPFFFRDTVKFLELVKPWKVKDPGFFHLQEWYDTPPTLIKELKKYGTEGVFGGFLEK